MRINIENIKKLIYFTPIVLIWILMILFTLELWAVFVYRSRVSAAQSSHNFNVRSVREAFHKNLWRVPWVDYLPNSYADFSLNGVHYNARINNIGFRGDNLAGNNAGIYTIVALGASTTVEGDDNGKTYPAYVQKILNSNCTKKINVINCGVSSLYSFGYNHVLDNVLNYVRPDLVVEYNCVNDICWKIFPLWKTRLSTISKLLLKSKFINLYLGDYFVPDDVVIQNDIDRYIIDNIAKLNSLLNHDGIKLSVSSFIYSSPDLMTKEQYEHLIIT